MDITIQQKPCLVETPQGFSVSYNNKFLYSKYSPQKTILQAVENLTIQPGTIFLCCSPILSYGLRELSNKLPENCLLLGCEFNSELLQFTSEHKDLFKDIQNFCFVSNKEIYNLPVILAGPEKKLDSGFIYPGSGKYRRIIRLDFSAGVQFNLSLYEELSKACVNALMTFWSNRVTLTKFGRLYSRNFFSNLKNLPQTTPISNYIGKINKPIIVCGAGESLDLGIKEFKSNRNDYYILCADTALQPLLKNNIIPDGVFIEEAQSIIAKAFIGSQIPEVHYFAGLSSIPQLGHIIDKKNISYFTTLFTDAFFINSLKEKNLLPNINKPFGSVGLTTVYYALQFRTNSEIPVYIYGLDFSYSAGRTHTKGAMAQTNRLYNGNKLNSFENFNSSYNQTADAITGKNNKVMYSTPTMENYAEIFNGIFEGVPNLYDSSDCGIKLNIPAKKPEPQKASNKTAVSSDLFDKEYCQNLSDYIAGEKNALLRLRDILTGEIAVGNIEEEITAIAKPREYLYLHFPDGNEFKYSQSFLNRIRTEIDRFLKIL